MHMQSALEERILRAFAFEDKIRDYRPYGKGHINTTYLVTLENGHRYILQKISDLLTRDAEHLMENIARVTEHLRKTEKDPRKVLTDYYIEEVPLPESVGYPRYWHGYEIWLKPLLSLTDYAGIRMISMTPFILTFVFKTQS